MKTKTTGLGWNSGDIPWAEGNIGGGNQRGWELCEAYALCCKVSSPPRLDERLVSGGQIAKKKNCNNCGGAVDQVIFEVLGTQSSVMCKCAAVIVFVPGLILPRK